MVLPEIFIARRYHTTETNLHKLAQKARIEIILQFSEYRATMGGIYKSEN
jgi:hypothetical protein